ncbi:GNAT family N-acetyltransferase [Amycolatopsis carbonis]|uniref:GNAT family N-acetyltransferase n=1 Tax=Amycolatopsis carbonis TaxID=715471 RepID=A0A9Y2IGR5_9PSEU|nr:GNAT family N-acetyltransferase [Amycolatopsis sp. 2-15]WIX78711.1 GNAT family N-acetyltransferase [Amycolatopsis sp. 2-15]
MELTWRPLTLGDAEQLATVFAAAEEVDRTGEHYTAADLREEMQGPDLDLALASTGAWAGDRLVSYAAIRRRDAADPVHMPRVEAMTHPEFRTAEVAAHLTPWFLDAGKRVHERAFPDAPLELHAGAHENEHWYLDALARAGFRRARSFVEMRADLRSLPPARPLPAEYEVVAFDERYDDLTRVARNATFSGHWGSAELSPEAWRHRITGAKDFRGDLSFLLLTPAHDAVVGFVLSAFHPADFAGTGVRELYVDYVGTLSELRGRGVATALLGHTLAHARGAGFERSALSVDTDNAYSAVGIYERCGYEVADTYYGHVLPI